MHKCNDYVIRDGQFIRDFEGMYRDIEDPWDQSANDRNCLAIDIAFLAMQKAISSSSRILDVGCADGYHVKRFNGIFPNAEYVGLDISPTVVGRAKSSYGSETATFVVDDIRCLNKSLCDGFDVIFSSKTLYYVAPEIDEVIANLRTYLRGNGWLVFVYNMTGDAFSKRWLTPILLRDKLIQNGFSESCLIELGRFTREQVVVGLFQHENT